MSVKHTWYGTIRKKDPMKRLLLASLLMALSGLAHAYGLPYAVDSFKQAQALNQQGASRHLLVFYTSPT